MIEHFLHKDVNDTKQFADEQFVGEQNSELNCFLKPHCTMS